MLCGHWEQKVFLHTVSGHKGMEIGQKGRQRGFEEKRKARSEPGFGRDPRG